MKKLCKIYKKIVRFAHKKSKKESLQYKNVHIIIKLRKHKQESKYKEKKGTITQTEPILWGGKSIV